MGTNEFFILELGLVLVMVLVLALELALVFFLKTISKYGLFYNFKVWAALQFRIMGCFTCFEV